MSARDNDVWAHGGGGHNEERGEKHTLGSPKVFVCVCVRVWVRKSKMPSHKEPVCAAALSCPSRWTLRGLFRTAVNRSPALPVGGLEAQEAPTTELHPVSLWRCA